MLAPYSRLNYGACRDSPAAGDGGDAGHNITLGICRVGQPLNDVLQFRLADARAVRIEDPAVVTIQYVDLAVRESSVSFPRADASHIDARGVVFVVDVIVKHVA